MGSLFQSAGFECDTKYMCSATKTWSFIKPQAAGASEASTAAGAAASTVVESPAVSLTNNLAAADSTSSNGSSNGAELN